MADRLGQQFGNYRLVSLLGQGSYAEVYLGQHERLELQAAIKVLYGHLTVSEAEHFQQEAQTIAKLAHPSIVRVFDFDVQNGVPFLVMDYAPNGSLRRSYPEGSIISLPQIISSIKQVAAALQYAHEQRFIHRDVKPENMLLGRQQEVLLSDFGLADLAHSTSSLSRQTTGGTLAYMAPEQIEGHPRAASDQYALGVVVYEWLTGSRPFQGSVTEVLVKHLIMPAPSLQERVPAISPEVEQVVLRALAKDSEARFSTVAAFVEALERASQLASAYGRQLPGEQTPIDMSATLSYASGAVQPIQPAVHMEATLSAGQSVVLPELAASVDAPQPPPEINTPQSQSSNLTPAPGQLDPLTDAAAPSLTIVPPPLKPALPMRQRIRHLSGIRAAILIGLVVVIIAGAVLGSLGLLAHFGALGARSGATTPTVVRGGIWTDDFAYDPLSLIPNGAPNQPSLLVDQALYLPLFYSDAQGVVHPGAASEVPTVQNGGISADAKTWIFHLRPQLVWSDGRPYDARDADYTWQLWRNPKFGAANTQLGNPYSLGLNLISGAEVSADKLSITFHLKQAFAPFLSLWVDGLFAPLPAHHFSKMTPEQILKSPENLNPTLTSGPFIMSESVPGDHYTLVRNPRYYRAREGLPYLDKVVFRIVDNDAILKDLQTGTITSAQDMTANLDLGLVQAYQRLPNYKLVTAPTSASFEGMFFNFHNMVLASHLEVRQAMAMAFDHQALIDGARHGLGLASGL